MTIDLHGALLNGETGGTLQSGSVLRNMQISTTAPLAGSLTVTGAGGVTVVASAGFNGVMNGGLVHSPAFFKLSDPADVGKARITWSVA